MTILEHLIRRHTMVSSQYQQRKGYAWQDMPRETTFLLYNLHVV